MSALLNETINIIQDIEMHSAWLGHIGGLAAEKMLRNRNIPYLYVLRAGEHKMQYYVTFIHEDLTIRHQPFVITMMPEGWHVEQGGAYGPFKHATIDDVIARIMHCEGEATPLVNFLES